MHVKLDEILRARPVNDRSMMNNEIFKKVFCFSVKRSIQKKILFSSPKKVETPNSVKLYLSTTKWFLSFYRNPFKNQYIWSTFGRSRRVAPVMLFIFCRNRIFNQFSTFSNRNQKRKLFVQANYNNQFSKLGIRFPRTSWIAPLGGNPKVYYNICLLKLNILGSQKTISSLAQDIKKNWGSFRKWQRQTMSKYLYLMHQLRAKKLASYMHEFICRW